MSINSISQTIASSGQASSATTQLAQDYENFITLLVAQVQNQDPLAPMESTEFISQLAQLTQVEQSVHTNSQMEALRQQLALSSALSETSLIGRMVTTPSDTVTLSEDGAEFSYKLENDSYQVQAQIRDSAGNLVKVLDNLSGQAGKMITVSWDGIGESGLPAAYGDYRVDIAALNAEGAIGSYTSYATAQVEAISYAEGATYLHLKGGREVQSGEIIRAQ